MAGRMDGAGEDVFTREIVEKLYSWLFGRELYLGAAKISDSRVTIPVEIKANGDEAALSFTMEYDRNLYSNPLIQLGEGVAGSSVLTINILEGRIGVLVDSNVPFAGSSETVSVVHVTFDVNSESKGESTFSLTDTVASRSISDLEARSIPIR